MSDPARKSPVSGVRSVAQDEVMFCHRCLTPRTFPGSVFDAEGICMPCRYAEQWDAIDWGSRRRELEEIADWGRRTAKSAWDCIIGVSGGKDSTRQAFYVRDELKLKPLLVSCSYPPEQQTDRGNTNLANLAERGFDIHIVAPGPQTSKRLMKYAFDTWGNLFKASELALYSCLPRAAIAFGIPLIFLGENPGLNFGGFTGSFDGNANRLREANTLAGAELEPWMAAGVPREMLYWYAYPSDADIDRADLRMIYLGYYMRDFNDTANTEFSLSQGLVPRKGIDARPEETGSLNPADALDDEFVHVNQYLKYLKLGFGKITQQASVQIRRGVIDRDQGIQLVDLFDGKCSDRYINRLCGYLNMPRAVFDARVEELRSKDLWQMNNHGEWELRYKPR